MTCEEFSGLLDQYLDNSLDADKSVQCQQHLESCEDCRLLLEIRKDCQNLDEGCEVPASFSTSWRQAVREQEDSIMTDQPKEKRRRIIPFSAKKWLAVAASLVFVFGGTWLVNQSKPNAVYSASKEYDSGMPNYYAMGSSNNVTASEPAMMMSEASYDSASEDAAPVSGSGESVSPQKIIRTIRLSLNTRAFDEDLVKLNAALAEHKGYVEYSDIAADRGSRRYANLTLRIPKDNLDAYLSQVKGIAQTVSVTESQEDVSERYSDTSTRLKTQTTKMDRLLDLLSKASLVEDVLEIEREIAETQYQIDRLTGSLRGMDSKVDYSTVTLYMTEEVVTPSPTELSLVERIRLAVSDAWMVVVDFLENLVILLSVTVPYLLILAIVFLIIKKIVRRKKK